jgi:hypothetical protein
VRVSDLTVAIPMVGLDEVAHGLHALLPRERREAAVSSMLLHGQLRVSAIHLWSIHFGFQAPGRSLWSRAPRLWTAFVEVDAGTGAARLLSSGGVDPRKLPAGSGFRPLPLMDLPTLPDTLLRAREFVMCGHCGHFSRQKDGHRSGMLLGRRPRRIAPRPQLIAGGMRWLMVVAP